MYKQNQFYILKQHNKKKTRRRMLYWHYCALFQINIVLGLNHVLEQYAFRIYPCLLIIAKKFVNRMFLELQKKPEQLFYFLYDFIPWSCYRHYMSGQKQKQSHELKKYKLKCQTVVQHKFYIKICWQKY